MSVPRIGPRQLLYENPYQQVYRVPVYFDGFSKEYYVNEYGSRTGVVVADGDRILLVRQYRFLVNGMAWEIPGGKVDQGESPANAAVREVLEETGLRCLQLQPLIAFHPGLDNYHNPSFTFHTRRFERIAETADNPREISGRAWLPLEECVRMIFSGEIVDSFTISALLAFKLLPADRASAEFPATVTPL